MISTPIGNVLAFMAVAASCAQPAKAYHHAAGRPLSLDVRPEPELDRRVEFEVAKAALILDNLDATNLFASPYLVSAIYYHDGFLADFPAERGSADPERRIIARISTMLSPESKAHFVSLLHEIRDRSNEAGPTRFVDPVMFSGLARGYGSHKYAIDLFAPEGSPVRSVTRGVVVLADRGWSPDDFFSTSSRKGGNAVIVFAPDGDRFYRYCHLRTVLVSAGDLVESGQQIGSVGHTGLNASRPGHGQHLHFEINEYADGHVRAINYRGLLGLLHQWR